MVGLQIQAARTTPDPVEFLLASRFQRVGELLAKAVEALEQRFRAGRLLSPVERDAVLAAIDGAHSPACLALEMPREAIRDGFVALRMAVQCLAGGPWLHGANHFADCRSRLRIFGHQLAVERLQGEIDGRATVHDEDGQPDRRPLGVFG